MHIDFDEFLQQVKEINSYLSKEIQRTDIPEDKIADREAALHLARDLNESVVLDLMKNEETIMAIRNDHPDAEAFKLDETKFQLKKQTKGVLDFLQEDGDQAIENWIGEVDESERVKKILRLWFTLVKSFNQHPWTAYPAILSDDVFYPNAKVVLLTEAQMLGK